MGGSRRPFVEDGCSVPTSGRQVSPVAHACGVRKRRLLFSLHDCSSPAPAGTITVAVSAGTAIERLRCSAETRPPPRLRAHAGAGEPGPEPRGDVHESEGLAQRVGSSALHGRTYTRPAAHRPPPLRCRGGLVRLWAGGVVCSGADRAAAGGGGRGRGAATPRPSREGGGERRHAALLPTFGRPERD